MGRNGDDDFEDVLRIFVADEQVRIYLPNVGQPTAISDEEDRTGRVEVEPRRGEEDPSCARDGAAEDRRDR